MATKQESIEIAVLQTQMKNVDVKLETLSKEQHEGFAVINLKLDSFSLIPAQVEDNRKRVEKLERAGGKIWILNTASAGVGALLFFLIQYAITHPN